MAQFKPTGIYTFSRQEMVAGFKFLETGRFEFFYSYGAVDRVAEGTFQVTGDTIHLKSDKEPGKDFTVSGQSKKGSEYVLKFVAPNPYLLSNIRCMFFKDGERQEVLSDQKGEARFAISHCDSIYVQHGLFPDIATLIKEPKNENNHFTIQLNPSLERVSFKGIDLKIEDENTLSCLPNYFMMMERIQFHKNNGESP